MKRSQDMSTSTGVCPPTDQRPNLSVVDPAVHLHDYVEAFESSPLGQALISVAGRFLAANQSLCALLGHPPGHLLRLCIDDVLVPDEVEDFHAVVGRLLAGGPRTTRREQRYVINGGGTAVTAQTLTLIRGPGGEARLLVLRLEDLTAVKDQERQLARERDRLREAQVVGRLGMWERDMASGLVTWSDALFELRGMDKAKFGRDLSAATSLVHPDDRVHVYAAVEEGTRTGREMSIRYRAFRVDDHHERWFESRFKGLFDGDTMVTLAGTVVDVTEHVVAEEKIRSAYALQQAIITASPDITFLFDLPTARTLWSSRPIATLLGYSAESAVSDDFLNSLVPESDRPTVRSALLAAMEADDDDVVSLSYRMIDAAGTLRWFACRAVPLHRAEDGSVTLGTQIADRIADVLRRPIEYNGVEHVISASIGVTYGPTGLAALPTEVTADALLQDADAAMYTAKQRGKDRFEVFEHGMRTDVVERGRVERVLRRALRSGHPSSDASRPPTRVQPDRLWAVYQPVFSAGTGALTGFEALARLSDAAGDPIAPDVFVQIAEETGLIQALGAFMLDQAMGQLAAWRHEWSELAAATIAVNISALQVGHASLAQDIGRALATHRMRPQDLVLELTETALLQAGRSTITTLQELRRAGMRIEIDDFGVGYASLRYLATMPMSGVKIDRSFTAGLPDDLVSRKIVSAIAALAADLELDCTVEGVETTAQKAALPDGVRLQGWLTGRPQAAADIEMAALVRGLG